MPKSINLVGVAMVAVCLLITSTMAVAAYETEPEYGAVGSTVPKNGQQRPEHVLGISETANVKRCDQIVLPTPNFLTAPRDSANTTAPKFQWSLENILSDGLVLYIDIGNEKFGWAYEGTETDPETVWIYPGNLQSGVTYSWYAYFECQYDRRSGPGTGSFFSTGNGGGRPAPPSLNSPAQDSVYGNRTIRFSWASSGAPEYLFQLRETNTGFEVSIIVDATSYEVSLPVGRYEWWIRAHNERGNSERSQVRRLVVDNSPPSYMISGHVATSPGKNVQNVRVELLKSGSLASIQYTDINGRYAFPRLIPGTYVIRAIRPGFTFSPLEQTVVLAYLDEENVDFDATLAIRVTHVEMTQAIQNSDNSVLLVENKPTFVRVYLDTGDGSEWVAPVKGFLVGIDVDTGQSYIPSRVDAINSPLTVYHETDWTRHQNDLTKTLDFTLPPHWTQGRLQIDVFIEYDSHSKYAGGLIKDFSPSIPMRVLFVPINYQGTLPDPDRIASSADWMRKVYPTAAINYTQSSFSVDWNKCLEKKEGLCGTICIFDKCGSLPREQHTEELLNELTTLHHNLNSFVYGWLPKNTFGGGISDPHWNGGKNQAAFGDDLPSEGPRILAHEIAHLLGRRHPALPPCEDQDLGTDWPYSTPNIDAYGLDSVDVAWFRSSSALKVPTSTYDYMSYCGHLEDGDVWTSAFTYSQISQALQTQTLRSLASESQSVVNQVYIVSGLIMTDDQVVLNPIWQITTTNSSANEIIGSNYCIELHDVNDTVLESNCFDINFFDAEEGSPVHVRGFNRLLPYHSDGAEILIRKQNATIASIDLGGSPPSIESLSVQPIDTQQSLVSWTASDADLDDLTYRVMYSPDDMSWYPLSTAITMTTTSYDTSRLPGSSSGKIRVYAFDGAHSSFADLQVSIADTPPIVRFLSTFENDNEIVPTPTFLAVDANDLEDGLLERTSIEWISDKDGVLGSGSQVLVTLSCGTHQITVRATDSAGNHTEISTTVNVGNCIYLPTIQN